MSDIYGPLALPVPAAAAGAAVADPLLDTLLAFFRAVLIRQAGAAWLAAAPATSSVVKIARAHNPSENSFVDDKTPGLFLWRSKVDPAVDIAADWRVRPSTLTLQWIFWPTAKQELKRQWDPFLNAMSCLDAAVELGRDPGWVVTGDTDPEAATSGSLLWKYAQVFSLKMGGVQRRAVVITMADNSTRMTYDALEMSIDVRERLTRDMSRYDLLDAVQGSITTTEAPTLTLQPFLFDFDPDAP